MTDWQNVDRTDLIDRFASLNQWAGNGERAPNKPLLVLLALSYCANGRPSEIAYSDVRKKLTDLLREFGPSRSQYHPEYPFWHLKNDDIWVVRDAVQLQQQFAGSSPTDAFLVRSCTIAGFHPAIYNRLAVDKPLLHEIAVAVLHANFPRSIHDDLLAAVELDLQSLAGSAHQAPRASDFRKRVLRAYEWKCAVCRYDLRLADVTIGLEAAHIKWHQAGGPDEEVNGLALCAVHHKLFDLGAYTIDGDHQVRVSTWATGSEKTMQASLLQFHRRDLARPAEARHMPAPEFLDWHIAEVFKGNMRD